MRLVDTERSYFCTFLEKGDTVYATGMESNGLFIINSEGKASIQAVFPKEEPDKRMLFADCMSCNNNIVFAPDSAEHIYVYDIENNLFRIIDFKLELEIKGYDENSKFSRIVEIDDYFYMMPATYPYIIKLNKQTFDIKYIELECGDIKYRFRRQYIRKDDEIFMISLETPYIMKFNLKTEKTSFINFSENNIGGQSICLIEDEMWVVSSGSVELFRINLKSLEVKKYSNVPDGFNVVEGERPFAGGFEKDGDIIILPLGGNIILKFDAKKEKFEEYKIKELQINDKRLACQYQNDKVLICYRRNENIWESEREYVFIKLPTLEIIEKIIVITDFDGYKEEIQKTITVTAKCYEESKWFTGNEFMRSVEYIGNKVNENNKENIGKKIYNCLK